MRVIYIHQYFKTPQEGGATRSYHLAKGLVDAGITVEVISGGDQDSYDQQWIEGIRVHYLPVKYKQQFGFFKRIKAFLRFVNKAKALLKKLPRPDLLYITSTPLTTGLIGLWARRQMAIPYIFEVRDLWPEAPVQVGTIRHPLLKKALYRLESKIYKNALSLVALSPGIAGHLRKICSERTVHLIPNFSDVREFYPQEKKQGILDKYGLKNVLTIAYTGALGRVNALEELLHLAEMAKLEGKNWQFLIMGKGSEEERLHQLVIEKSLETVHFIPFGSKYHVNEILGISDLAWISFDHLPVLRTNSPNKFFDAIAAGKPIIVNHKGWVYDLVKTHNLGITCLPTNLKEAFLELEKINIDRNSLLQMGINSRRLAENHFNKELAVDRIKQIILPDNHSVTVGDEAYTLTA